jgi:hypothetical protein
MMTGPAAVMGELPLASDIGADGSSRIQRGMKIPA